MRLATSVLLTTVLLLLIAGATSSCSYSQNNVYDRPPAPNNTSWELFTLFLGGLTQITNQSLNSTTLQGCIRGFQPSQVDTIKFETYRNARGIENIVPGAFLTLPELGLTGVKTVLLRGNSLTNLEADTFQG